jgi:O-antigen ligase
MSVSAVPLARPLPRRAPRAAAPAGPAPNGLGFFLFVVLNGSLFIRPAEVVSSLQGWEIYQYLILVTLAVSFPAVLWQLQPRALEKRPITVFILILLLAVLLSHLVHVRFEEASKGGTDFLKILLYYLLFVGLVTTPRRLRSFLWWMTLFAAACTTLALLNYYHFITLPQIKVTKDGAGIDQKTGMEIIVERLTGTGIFYDPNDFCVLMVVSILLAFYWLTDRPSGLLRILWLGPLALFLYALALTHSRGGMLALLAGLLAFFQARYGWQRAFTVMGVLLPMVLLVFAGRQTDFSATTGTGQDRIQLWREGMVQFLQSPVFGIGCDHYAIEAGQVAHNSYLHAFTELGFFGGLCFLGAFAFALRSLYFLGRPPVCILDPDLRRLHPYLLGLLAGYAIGMMSLTLVFILPTYTLLGAANVFFDQVRTEPPTPPAHCNARLFLGMARLSLLFLAGMYVFVRLVAAS